MYTNCNISTYIPQAVGDDVLEIRQFQLLTWPADPGDGLIQNVGPLVDLMEVVQAWQKKTQPAEEAKVLIQCL